MSDTSQVPPGTTLEFLNTHASQSRRARPPHLDPENGYVERVPLRPEADKLRRRESRLGLRNIFGWNKAASSDKAPGSPTAASRPPADAVPRPGGIRASIAELNWPYSLSNGGAQRSEVTLPSLSLPTTQGLNHKKSASVVRSQTPSANAKGALANWDPPPLFKAYPQAIKHSHLPACAASAEAILRLHKSGFAQSSLALDIFDESGTEKNDKGKKKHRRNASNSSLKLEWTTKVFVLVTSGYLLQYTGSGAFDRLPEKILHLGKDSAAFASDVIPGRHWVLQVCSVAEPDRTPPAPSSSLFSRLPFRAQERKQTSNLLMVFEGAEEMDSWITTLRREIEALGGRKYLSETGKPKVDDIEVQLKSQTSQRTLVVRDPDRFSRVMSPELQWDSMMSAHPPDIQLDGAETDFRDQSFDDTSTASGISHDGRQLDGLRDSTNRLSFISSGQRTVITSAGSSPACSPIRDSFATTDDGYVPDMYLQDEPRPRARPNAAAINDRRQSLQTMNHLFEMRVSSAQVLRPHSTATYPGAWQPDGDASAQSLVHTIPNFSVPQGMGKRYSVGRPIPAEQFHAPAPFPSRISSRRPPPTALAINGRPLSLVEDQPSPLSAPASEDGVFSTAPDTPSLFSPWAEDSIERRDSSASDVPDPHPPTRSRRGSSNHRRQLSSTSVRSCEKPACFNGRQTPSFVLPDDLPLPPPLSPAPQGIIRPKSSLDFYSRAQSPTTMSMNEALRNRRLSLYAQDVEKPTFDHREFLMRSRTPSLKPVPRSSQHLRVDSLSKSLLQRRSLSQLAEGPPPGPPPTRALPPIPRKLSGPHGKMI
ncbi:hypothetical protein B0T14DRAFT_420856 [Immersiella caudata]|uniref:PH domain-containing protein n=1 Tax=Immersiella caudata TaxID=314043 RepID=A0AA39X5I4_9PEZI|nr:hypothetical protein B0T14DRAFT_420856 [Immersiella caudata]